MFFPDNRFDAVGEIHDSNIATKQNENCLQYNDKCLFDKNFSIKSNVKFLLDPIWKACVKYSLISVVCQGNSNCAKILEHCWINSQYWIKYSNINLNDHIVFQNY